ncbi:MAG: winged helix-turn-helix domain-containing protein [Anaerolineales bacterium]|nr:winged helix-turn-helix domain-containing protein [Anaerolineales bacterium]
MESQSRYSISYRSVETHQVMDWIRAGQCGNVIGMRGAGKSNFLRFLFHKDVQQHYLGQKQADFLFVLVNLLSLAECTSWGFYELLLTSLLDQIQPPQISSEALEALTALHREAVHARDTLTAQRAVERGVAILCRSSPSRLILFFDEFDAAFQQLDPSLFRILRATRDAHKDQIAYVVITTCDLARLRDDVTERQVEHFYRLVGRNVCGLGPYNKADAWQMLTSLADQNAIELDQNVSEQLIERSGGQAGLLKAMTSLLWGPQYGGDLVRLNAGINDEPIIARECRKVWEGLAEDERAALNSLANEQPVDQQIADWLKFRGMLQKTDPPKLFSPLFELFVQKQAPASSQGTLIRRSPRLVQINGRRIVTLTDLEFEALCYLYNHRDRVCTKEDLVCAVYRQQYGIRQGDLTDAMLQTLISRLREKIEPDRAHPRYVKTVRGEGYRFAEPTAREQPANHAERKP